MKALWYTAVIGLAGRDIDFLIHGLADTASLGSKLYHVSFGFLQVL